MATNIAPIQGLIELQDNFTSQIGIAQAALSNFSKENQESLKAVAGAAGLVAAAFGAVAAATIEMGIHGSQIQQVDQTLEHFTGSASAANDVMKNLRDGTKGTVDNFALAGDAAHLLSAGVKLTTDDFSTLAQASLVLSNRGLGPTKDMMQLVSDAMITGRTRALSLALGVVDVVGAEEKYAASLGVTKAELSAAGLVEAKRLAIMELLSKAVKDAGTQELTFGQQIELARTKAVNFYDDLSKAVAVSPVFAAGMKEIGVAFTAAFGNDNTTLVKDVVHWIEQAAIMGVNFGLAAIELARVVNVAWSAIKVIILGTETVILGVATTVLGTIEMLVTTLAKVPGAPAWLKDTAVAAHDASTYMMEMTKSVAAETVEASKGLVGHSEFDKTLDKLGGTLMNVKDAMVAATKETGNNAATTDIAAANAKKLAVAAAAASVSMVDQAKVTALLVKSSQELSVIWDNYFVVVAKNSKTSGDEQRTQIEETFNKQVAALNYLDPLFNDKYKAYRAIADESLHGIESDWASVRDKSIEGMQQQADKAYKTYQDMVYSSYHFTRDALDEQLQKYRTLQEAASGWGKTVVTAVSSAADSVLLLDHAWVTDADIAAATINKTTVMVKTLTGEVISLIDAQKRQQAGGAFTYDLSSQSGVEQYRSMNPGMNVTWSDQQIMAFVLKGGTLQQLMQMGVISMKPYAEGGDITENGIQWVGERGPEAVQLPVGSRVYPASTPSGNIGGRSGDTYLSFQVNGTAVQAAQQIKDIIMRELKSQRQFGAS